MKVEIFQLIHSTNC